MERVLIAFLLTLIAGIATGLGSLIIFFIKDFNKKLFALMLGFSAGVMLYISFVEIMQESKTILIEEMGEKLAMPVTVAAFFGGIILIGIIDKLVPEYENPHEMHCDISENCKSNSLYKVGMTSAAVIFIHNFPEGMVTFMAALVDIKLGIFLAIAILIHNIPEGMAVAVPIYYATGDKKKAIKMSFLSGLSEPIGAIMGYLILAPILSQTVLAITFAAIAGIMVYISLDELLPAAEKYGEHHMAIFGVISGMAVMALSLLMM